MPLNLRQSKRGFWLSCSTFPKCRGRTAWANVDPTKQTALTKQWKQHLAKNPVPTVRNSAGVESKDQYEPAVIESKSKVPSVIDSDAA